MTVSTSTFPAAQGLPASLTAPSTSATPKASGFAGGDFETFLKMLTTQIRNQDPLNPMEGSDFAVQLATFSGVEQQVRTNQLLEKLSGEGDGLSAMAVWIGKDVRTTAPVLYSGEPLTLDIKPETGATKVELVTLNQRGAEVSRESIGLGTGEVDWQGRLPNGNPVPAGVYTFKLISSKGKDIIKTEAVGTYIAVTGVQSTTDGARLTLAGGTTALESEVTELRERR